MAKKNFKIKKREKVFQKNINPNQKLININKIQKINKIMDKNSFH